MDTLAKTLHELTRTMLRKPLVDLLSRTLPKHGIRLSKRRIENVAAKVMEGKDLEAELGPQYADKLATMEPTPEDKKLPHSETDKIRDELPDFVRRFADKAAVQLLDVLKRRWRNDWSAQRRDQDAFRRQLEKQWGAGLRPLRMLITIAREYGSEINNAGTGTGDRPSKSFEMLTRLHARSCQVAEEIVCLLSNGLADGAMARWRTLHEVTAVAQFIQIHGDALAERYERHQVVEGRKAALQYQQHQERLKQEPISKDELETIEAEYNRALGKYGPAFKGDYGWAAEHLKKGKPSFANIQQAAGIDHLAPYYKMASHNVHANPKGVLFKLGHIGDANVLLAGPSNAGLADPGHTTALALVHVSRLLLDFSPTLDNLVRIKIMTPLEVEAGIALGKAHEELGAQERARRSGKST